MKRAITLLFASALFPFALQAQTPAPGGHGGGHGAPASTIPDWLDAAPKKTPPPDQLPNAGIVVSIVPTPQYSYVEVDLGDRRDWIAAPAVELKAGDAISYSNGSRMMNFSSKAIGRTFPSIMFVDYVAALNPQQTQQVQQYMQARQAQATQAATRAAQQPAPQARPSHQGTVVTHVPSDQYSYIEVNTGDKTDWIAAPTTQLKVGDRIAYGEGARMTNFSSKAIGRTFPSIMFVGQVSPVSAEGAQQHHGGGAPHAQAPHGAQQAAPHGAQAPHAGHAPAPAPHAIGAQGGQPARPAPAANTSHEGTIVTFIPTAQYAYIEVKAGDKTEWIAAPAITLKEGDRISYGEGARMTNFSSKAIGRSFPSIMFVGAVTPLQSN